MIELNWIKKRHPVYEGNIPVPNTVPVYSTVSRGYVSPEEMRSGVISSNLPPVNGNKLTACKFVPMTELDEE